ncbi:MAG: DUF2202 domain-containing protein [Dermatophilaceae bacterium]
MSTRIRTALALAAALVAGGACYASQATATPAVTTLSSAAGASAASTSLDPALAAKLVALLDEERMAHDLYQLFSDRYDGARPFSMIVRSETQHTAAVRSLLATYGIADPTTTLPAGTYATPAIQALYDQLKAAGLVSVDAAERVGVDLETRDIADLKAALVGVTRTDIRRVLESLTAASEHHLRAFRAAVANTSTSGMPADGSCMDSSSGAGPGMGHGMGSGSGSGPGMGYGAGLGGGYRGGR